jgi:hypothetical protein
MIMKMLSKTLRVLAVLLIGFVSAVIGSIIVINLGHGFALDFTFNSWEGYKAPGPIGIILGSLIGLIRGSVFLFRKRRKD